MVEEIIGIEHTNWDYNNIGTEILKRTSRTHAWSSTQRSGWSKMHTVEVLTSSLHQRMNDGFSVQLFQIGIGLSSADKHNRLSSNVSH